MYIRMYIFFDALQPTQDTHCTGSVYIHCIRKVTQSIVSIVSE